MSLKELYEKEKYVVVNGQTKNFRLVKYCVILLASYGIYLWTNVKILGIVLLSLIILSIVLHFIFRWKTKAWTKPWGPYKPLPLFQDTKTPKE